MRRFDPIRMAVEHETLLQEKLRGGQLNDGKEVSVDVTILDPFLIPDGLSEREIDRLKVEVRRRRDLLGISEMRLIRDVRICEYTFAYTRTSSSPTVKRDKAVTPRCRYGFGCLIASKLAMRLVIRALPSAIQ